MAHSDNIISKIKLPDDVVYDVHDSDAIHNGDLDGNFVKIHPIDAIYNNNDSWNLYLPSSFSSTHYVRITIPDTSLTAWTMLYFEVSIMQRYNTGACGKLYFFAMHNSTTGDWITDYLKGTIAGNLSTEIKIYGSDRKYLYIKGIAGYGSVSIDKVMCGNTITQRDISGITLDTVTTLPETYQTGTIYGAGAQLTWTSSGLQLKDSRGDVLSTITNSTIASLVGPSLSIGWTQVTNKPNFATVATSGDYNDLINKPDDELFWCTYDTTTYQAISDALNAGRLPVAYYNGSTYVYYGTNGGYHYLTTGFMNYTYYIRVNSSDVWTKGSHVLEKTNNKTLALSSSSTDAEYPSAKAVYDAVEEVREVAEGRKQAYVASVSNNPELNSQSQSIILNSSLIDVEGETIPLTDFNIGDSIYVTETNVPDRWVSATTSSLPEGYTQVSYIQGDGTAYIDLGTPLTDSDNIAITFGAKYTSSAQIFGARTSASSNNIILACTSASNTYLIDWNNSLYSTYRLTGTLTDDTIYKAILGKTYRAITTAGGSVVVDSSTLCTDTITTATNAYLFLASGAPPYNNPFTGKIYDVQIGSRAHFIPCINPNNEVGVYDVIGGHFYGNAASSGSFTAGSNVSGITLQILETSVNLSNYYNKTEVNGLLDTKQNTIDAQHPLPYAYLSGTPNLATVATSGNYNDLTNKPIFWCTYNTTTYQEVSDEVASGKLLLVRYGGVDYVYYGTDNGYHYFTTTLTNNSNYVRVSNTNTWSVSSIALENSINKTTTLSNLSTDAQYPTAKATYDAIEAVKDIALGTKTAYVVSAVENPELNSTDNIINVENNIVDTDGVTIALGGLSKGDVIYIVEANLPDRWVGDVQESTLPEGYTKLAYIEGTGVQYINTNIVPKTTDLSITLDMMWTGTVLNDFESFVGLMDNGTLPRLGIHKYSSKYMYGINATISPNTPVPDNNRHIVRTYSNGVTQYLYVDGALTSSSGVTSTALDNNTLPIYLFARNSATMNVAKMRLYGATIAINGELYTFVPCKNSNNIAGLYDVDHDVFYQSAVSSQFDAGPVANNGIQLMALETSQIDVDSYYTKAQVNGLLDAKQNVINAQSPLPYSYLSGAPNLANVATSGSYNDLIDTPQLAAVATSGDYDDLINLPIIPDVSNFVERNELATVATSGSYNDLTNKPTLIGDVKVNGSSVVDANHIAQVSVPTQTSDLTNNSGFITKAVNNLDNYTLSSNLATVATSGAYSDLSGTPNLATVATTGDYSDLTNKPVNELYFCTYGTTTVAQIDAALALGQTPVCWYGGRLHVYFGLNGYYRYFSTNTNRQAYIVRVVDGSTLPQGSSLVADSWSYDYDTFEFQYYKRTSTQGWGGGNPANVSNNYYPSEKLTYDAIQEVREIAEGRKKTLVCSDVTNVALNSQDAEVSVSTLTDVNGVTYNSTQVSVGDTVYVTQTDVPDRWVSDLSTANTIKLAILETAKVPVTDVQVNNTSVVNNSGVAQITLATVATSGSYTDLSNTPNLATVATSGDYDDLTNKPTIPDVSGKVDKVSSTDNAIVRFDGTSGAIQNSLVKIDDNGNIKQSKSIYLTSVGSSINTETNSKLIFSNADASTIYSYLVSNQSGAFCLAKDSAHGYLFYPGGNYSCFMPNFDADLGRNDSNGGYSWRNLYTKGSIYRNKTGGGWYQFDFPTKSGTFALVSDIPSVNYPVTSVNGQTGAVVISIPSDTNDLTNGAGYLTSSDLANVAISGSYEDLTDLPTLPQKLSDLGEDTTSIHVSQSQANTWSGKQNALTFDNTPTENSSNPVTSDGIYDAIQDVREIAEGKSATYVISDVTNPTFNSQDSDITVSSSVTDINSNTIALADFNIGDIIYITQTDVPDRWVSNITVASEVVTSITCSALETAKVPITSVSVNGTTVTPNNGNVDINVPTTYLKSVTSIDKVNGGEVISPNNILRITKQDNTTFDYEPNSVKFKDFSANQEADENNKTINLNLSPYNQGGIWYTVASSTIAKMANAPGNVASGECMLENRPLGSTRYSYQIFTHKAGTVFSIWQRVQNNTGNWGNWQPAPTCPTTTAAGTTISASDTEYIASITTNGKSLYRTTKKVGDFVTTSTSQNVNGTKTFTVDQVMSNNRAWKWTKADGTTTVEMFKLASNGLFYIGNSGVDIFFKNSIKPETTSYNLGSSSYKWGSAYINDAVYTPKLNNGADVNVPTTAGTLALVEDLSDYAELNTTSLENYSTTDSFADVAFSGSYNDLDDTPSIPDNSVFVDKTSAQHDITGAKTFKGAVTFGQNGVTNPYLSIYNEVHFYNGGSPTDYAYGYGVGIFGNAMMCNKLYIPEFRYRTKAMQQAGKVNTIWNLPYLDSGSTYTLATTSDLTNFITKSVNDLDNYTLTSNLATVATSGSYNDLTNKPTIPTVNNATLTIQKNSTTIDTFTANSSTDTTVNIVVPTATSDLTNDSGFITSSDIPLVFTDYVIPTT